MNEILFWPRGRNGSLWNPAGMTEAGEGNKEKNWPLPYFSLPSPQIFRPSDIPAVRQLLSMFLFITDFTFFQQEKQ